MIENKLNLAELNRSRTTEKVKNALQTLKRGSKQFTLVDVAEKAEISRRTLYNRPDLMEEVREAITIKKEKLSPQEFEKKPKATQEIRYTKLREQNKTLIEEQKLLLEQNVILTQRITELEQRQVALLETIHSIRLDKVVNLSEKRFI
ncbi:hypothetical protein GCM10008018_36990 [Paenibacillus marchantiophytorum]|uniref:Transposase n=1 Tax=Paenibacillus marchantiophytorum TaxID=1619310 RepID=A0ABQ1EU47_9BACL|nr:hypothetical protein [Paenibacillus marchantiophytorum]GFZ87348.1 hypothetical protein GCM10008018_36990 [Paenibacillus marchantiophytorum]